MHFQRARVSLPQFEKVLQASDSPNGFLRVRLVCARSLCQPARPRLQMCRKFHAHLRRCRLLREGKQNNRLKNTLFYFLIQKIKGITPVFRNFKKFRVHPPFFKNLKNKGLTQFFKKSEKIRVYPQFFIKKFLLP